MSETVDNTSIQLLARWQQGEHQAADQLFERFADRLVRVVHRRLPAGIVHRVDPEDVVQSVFRCFFVAAQKGRYVLRQSGDLWRLLVAIALRKVREQYRHYHTAKRDVGFEDRRANGDAEANRAREAPSNEPAPDEAVVLADLLEQIMRPFPPLNRRMIELRLQGHGLEEIAEATGRCRMTVLRALERFKQLLEQEQSRGEDIDDHAR